MLVDAVAALIRALGFLALFQAAGLTIFMAIFGHQVRHSRLALRQIAGISAVAGALLVAVHYGLEAARLAGTFSGAFDASLQRMVLGTSLSTAAAMRVLGLVLMAVAATRDGRAALLAIGGVVLALGAFLFVGHVANAPDRLPLSVLLGLHLVVVAFWFGALPALLVVVRTEAPALGVPVIRRFSRLAGITVPAIFAAGLLMMLLLIHGWAVFMQPYGWILLGKVAAFAVLMVLAGLNRFRLVPALADGGAAGAMFQRVLVAEYALIGAVLLATAVMTTLFSPD